MELVRAYNMLSAEHAVSNIALRRIKISRIRDVNDPFELQAINVANKKEFRGALKGWKDELHESKGLLCFSKSWQNPVLWSHYGARHSGMCLGFDIAPAFVKPIAYLPDRIIAAVENDTGFTPEEELVEQLLFTKFKHWSYEEELRAYVQLDKDESEGGLYFMPFGSTLQLREVILGASCPIPVARIRELVAGFSPTVYVKKARLAFRSFKVVEDQSSR